MTASISVKRDPPCPTQILRNTPEAEDLVPVRALNEYIYCPRVYHLMYVQGIFLENADTITGSAQHERAERRRTKGLRSIKSKGPIPTDEPAPWPGLPAELTLSDETLGLIGKLDMVKLEDGLCVPVEYKKGAPPYGMDPFTIDGITIPGGAWPGDQVQLCAQGLLLRAHGYPVRHGLLHYRTTRTTVHVPFEQPLIDLVHATVMRARATRSGPMPPPLVDSPKCPKCSLAPACLPDETNALLKKIDEPRRIIPGRDDGGSLYLVTQGAKVGLSGECLMVTTPEHPPQKVPIKDITSVTVLGGVQITTQALTALMETGRQVTFATRTGRLLGVAGGFGTKNVQLRLAQVAASSSPEKALPIARALIASKISNQRTLVRRNAPDCTEPLVDLARGVDAARNADSISSLMGIEGTAARTYFRCLPSMLRGDPDLAARMEGRTRRPPRDPINAMLSFGYALLMRDAQTACVATGFDPMVGFLHAVRPGRPALALDLMEPFRPLVVDSTVLRLVNTGAVTSESFHTTPAAVLLTSSGRTTFLHAYEHRMDEMVTHPTFGYRMSYRRMLELEARLLARFLEGELPVFTPLTTR